MPNLPWQGPAEHVLHQLNSWIFQLQQTLAEMAFIRGDVPFLDGYFTQQQAFASDLVVRRLPPQSDSLLLVYLDGLIDPERLTTLLTSHEPLLDVLQRSGVAVSQTRRWHEVVQGYLTGHLVVFQLGLSAATLVDLAKPPHRAIDVPHTELAIRGPQEAFVEPASVQVAQIRQRLRSPHLIIESITVGRRLPVTCHIVYVDGLAEPRVVDTVRERLQRIHVDSATNATRIGSLIRDKSWAWFPTVRYTERVDLAALQLESGKVAILVAGDPFVITVPVSLGDFYRTSADYSTLWHDATFNRVIRGLAWAFGVLLPGLYIAVTEVNPDLISPTLFDLVSGSHTGLPFTPLVEVVVMILVIEILREAALRLPTVLATTIGTVGAIVVGTSVVRAGFVSAQIIVLMTFTALSLFSVPTYELLSSWRLTNWLLLLSAFVLGIYGLILAFFGVSVELVSLTSFGTPYLIPLSPWRPKDWPNTLWRVPWRHLRRRLTESRAQDLHWEDPS